MARMVMIVIILTNVISDRNELCNLDTGIHYIRDKLHNLIYEMRDYKQLCCHTIEQINLKHYDPDVNPKDLIDSRIKHIHTNVQLHEKLQVLIDVKYYELISKFSRKQKKLVNVLPFSCPEQVIDCFYENLYVEKHDMSYLTSLLANLNIKKTTIINDRIKISPIIKNCQ